MKEIYIEASSPSQLFFLLPNFEKKNFKKITLIWYGNEEKIIELKKFFNLNLKIISFNSQKISRGKISFSEIWRFKNILKKNIRSIDSNSEFYTPYNSGIRHGILASFLNLKFKNIILFDDGMIGIFKNKSRLNIFKNVLYFFIAPNFRQNREYLFADKKYLKGISLMSEYVYRGKNINIDIEDSSETVRQFFLKTYSEHCEDMFLPNSALLCTHHSVETGKMKKNEYLNQIKKVVEKIKENGIDHIYFKMHHDEDNSKEQIYESLGLKKIRGSFFPSEVYLASDNIKILANPYNSVFFISFFLKLLKDKKIICYDLKNHYLFQERKKLFRNLSIANNINFDEVSL